MSEFIRIPVGAGPIRIKFGSAEWSPQGNKLILHTPIDWYEEENTAERGSVPEGDKIIMIDKAAIGDRPITNPLRLSLAWTGAKGSGKPPTATFYEPPTGAEPYTPTQAARSGGGERGGNSGGGGPRLNRAQWEAAMKASLDLSMKLVNDEWAKVFEKIAGCAMFVDPEEWAANSVTESSEPEPEDDFNDDIPF
jgi:hypothetical protein